MKAVKLTNRIRIDYYKGFNNSIGTFGGVLQYINGTKERERNADELDK